MMDQEERIAASLRRNAPVYARPMPKGTRLRVRLRQASLSLASATAIAVLAFGALGALSVAQGSQQPASQQTVPPPAGTLPSPQGDVNGSNDSAAATPDAGTTVGEDTSAHGTNSTIPYTEQVEGQEVYLLTQKHPVAVGHVHGVEWSLAAYDTRPYEGDAFTHFLGGNCGDLMVGDQGEYGGISFCLRTPETGSNASFAMAGFGNDFDDSIGPITGYAGLVGGDVTSVELRLSNGHTDQLPLYDAPSGIDARYFGVFLDPGAQGEIVALGQHGDALGHQTLCVETPTGPTNVGCGHGLQDTSSVVTTVGPVPSG
jgi:hypothetical protein